MGIMQSVEVPASRLASIRQIIPAGIEHYVVPKGGFTYINLRTNDHGLIRQIMETARASA